MQDFTDPQYLIDNFGAVLLILLLLVVIWVAGRFVKFILKRIRRIPPDAKNGLALMVTLAQILGFFVGAAFALGADPTYVLGSSAILATALGFASTSVVSNLVGGLYIIITRPFGVGDMIRISNSNPGVVLEIGINYTKLLRIDRTVVTVPNSKLLNATLLNSNISVSLELRRREQAKKLEMTGIPVVLPDLLSEGLLDTFDREEIVRFPTTVQLKLNQYTPALPLSSVRERMDKICDRFEPIFGFRPRYFFGKHVFRQDTHLVITAKDNDVLLDNYPLLMEAIMEGVFEELQGGSS